MTTTQIDRVVPLPEAAARMGISVDALTRLVSDGMIRAVQLPDGSLAVTEIKNKPPITPEDFKHLRGNPISVSEAAEKYGSHSGFHRRSIIEWVARGYIHVIKPGYRMQIDEADVAYCAEVYRRRKESGTASGAPLLDSAGRPYELKRPDVAEYRRKKKEAFAARSNGGARSVHPRVAAGKAGQQRKHAK